MPLLRRWLPWSLSVNAPTNERSLETSAEIGKQTHVAEMSLGSRASAPLYMEDLQVGDRWVSPERKITAEAVAEFAKLTGDHDPLHTDNGTSSPFGEPVAHGLLGLSVLAGLSTEHPRVATLALVGISDWSFEAPVFFGDRVRVVTEVQRIEKHGRRAGRVTWIRKLINQGDQVVQHGRFISLIATRARARHLSADESTQAGSLPPR